MKDVSWTFKSFYLYKQYSVDYSFLFCAEVPLNYHYKSYGINLFCSNKGSLLRMKNIAEVVAAIIMNKQVKAALKSAKQLIQNKDYDAALQQCKELLNLDPKNYNGFVFSGLCCAELNQRLDSQSSYHDAIKLQPDQILAYQGLVSLYTKHWVVKLSTEDTEDLISAYKNIIKLICSADKQKVMDLKLSLSQAHSSIGQFSDCLTILEQLFVESNAQSLESVYGATIQCFKSALGSYQSLINFFNLIFHSVRYVCERSDGKANVLDKEEAIRLLFIYLQTDDNVFRKYLKEIMILLQALITQESSSSFFADIANQIYIQNRNIFLNNLPTAFTLPLLEYDGVYKDIVEGYQSYDRNEFEKCVQLLSQSIDTCPHFIPAQHLLCKAYSQMCRWSAVESSARNALQRCRMLQTPEIDVTTTWLVRIISISDLRLQLSLCLADALCGSDNPESWKTAVGTFEKLSKIWPESTDVYLGMAKAFLKQEKWKEAASCLQKIESWDEDNSECKCWKAYIQFMNDERLEALEELQSIIVEDRDSFIAHFLLGKLMWEADVSFRVDKSKSFSILLKAAKLNPYHGETFLYLGHYYRDVAKDMNKALRCYEKSYNLGPKNEAIGTALADQYIAEGNIESAIPLYESVTDENPPEACSWAWLRLGLCRLKNNEINLAIVCFQATLRSDMNSYICWECLGEGYLQRGSYTAAWKAFNRAHELEPSSVYSIYQMASIKQILCQYTESISEFNDVLSISPDYVPALTGLGESHFLLARNMLLEGRDLTSLDHVNEAVKFLTKALMIRGSLSCLWKLLGDCMTFVHPLDDSIVSINASNVLLGYDNKEGTAILSKTEALKLGGKFYCQALRLHNNATLWHDFGLNYFYQAQSNASEGEVLAGKAVQTLQKGLSLEETSHVLWNSLGVVAASRFVKNYALAQHSFIKSIKCEPNNAMAWSNLGSFYLSRGNLELAHEAYKTAQSLDPAFVNSWIGQGLVAEGVGREEAMDLFRHATELGLHGQAGVGYATWVCNLLSECKDRNEAKYKENIHDLNAVVTSITQLSKYCARHPRSGWALSLFGFVLEEAELKRSALVRYKQCLDVLQARSVDEKLDLSKAKSDYARMLCKNQEYTKAVEVYKGISPLNKYEDVCGLAVALCGCGRMNEAHAAFVQAKDIASTNEQQVNSLVAIATLAWKRKDTTSARELLQSSGCDDVRVLQALCAVGILEKDSKLARSAADKLLRYDDSHKRLCEDTFHNCLLVATSYAMANFRQATKIVQKYIRRYPDEWRFRQLLSQLCLSVTSQSANVDLAYLSSKQAVANYVTDDRMLTTEAGVHRRSSARSAQLHQDVLANHAVLVLGAGKHHHKGDKRSADSLKTAQRFVHCHPHSAESWSVLSAACHAKAILSRLGGTNGELVNESQRMASHITSIVPPRDPLNAWSIKQNMMSLLIEKNKHEKLSSLVTQISSSYEDADAISTLSECSSHLENHSSFSDELVADLETISKSSSSPLALKLACHAYVSAGMYEEAFVTLSETLKSASERCERIKIAITIMSLVVEASSETPAKHDHWCALGRDGTEVAVKLAGGSPIVQLLQGLMFVMSKNLKKARLSLQKVFNHTKLRDELCLSRTIAAWNLYKIFVEKNDGQEIEKLLSKWSVRDDPYMEVIKRLLPFT